MRALDNGELGLVSGSFNGVHFGGNWYVSGTRGILSRLGVVGAGITAYKLGNAYGNFVFNGGAEATGQAIGGWLYNCLH